MPRASAARARSASRTNESGSSNACSSAASAIGPPIFGRSFTAAARTNLTGACSASFAIASTTSAPCPRSTSARRAVGAHGATTLRRGLQHRQRRLCRQLSQPRSTSACRRVLAWRRTPHVKPTDRFCVTLATRCPHSNSCSRSSQIVGYRLERGDVRPRARRYARRRRAGHVRREAGRARAAGRDACDPHARAPAPAAIRRLERRYSVDFPGEAVLIERDFVAGNKPIRVLWMCTHGS
jgi:hypothetical protein